MSLNFVKQVSRWLSPAVWLFRFSLILSLVVFALEVVSPEVISGKDYMLTGLLGFVWSLNALLLAQSYQPPSEIPESGWWRRFKYKLRQFLQSLLLLLFAVLTVVNLWLTFRLLRID